MVSPLELLVLAQSFAARIPMTPEFSEERNAALLAVGVARLKFDDISNAQWALESLDDVSAQAELRIEIGKWVGEHPASEAGRNILRETVNLFSTFERSLTRRSVTELVPAVFKVFGTEAVHSIAWQLEDPFSASHVYVMLSQQLQDGAARREQLLAAEKLAMSTISGNRDYALRWVFRGYQSAGLTDDAERVRHLASRDPEVLTNEEAVLFAEVEKVLPQTPVDTPLDRLRRFLDYQCNDLKVVFLIDACHQGGVADPETERLIRSQAFQSIESARPPRLGSDTSFLDAAGMARFLFGRPVCRHAADRSLLEALDHCDRDPDAAIFVRQLSSLFRDFGKLAQPFSPEQVEQGLWFVFGHPFWLRDLLQDRLVPPETREDCLRAMIHPFRDYYLPREDIYSGSAFFMWWDSLSGGYENQPGVEAVSLEVIQETLRLPGKGCRVAAIHGLNHMHPNPVAAETVRQFLAENRASLTADEIAWIEACAVGAAQ